MPIGPRGERLPYPGEPGARAAAVGNGSRVDQAMARSGPLPRGGQRLNGGPPMGANMGANPDALMQELQMLGQRAQEIIGQLQSMGIDPLQMGGPPQGPAAGPPPMGPPPGLL